MKRKRVLVVGDRSLDRVRDELDRLLPWLRERVDVAGVFDGGTGAIPAAGADLLIVLGGDGAILATAARLEGAAVPLIGIRLGHFGFLAELDPQNCRAYLERIFAGEGTAAAREMLECEVLHASTAKVGDRALNDAVVTAGAPGKMITLELEVDGQHVANYRGDGLIIATPVGSTAHSLAAGGPVVEPGSRLFVVTPLAAHTLSSRPLVLDSSHVLTIRIGRAHKGAGALAIDGQRTHEVGCDDRIVIRRAAQPLWTRTIVERSFFETLREKFRWGGSVALDGDRGP